MQKFWIFLYLLMVLVQGNLVAKFRRESVAAEGKAEGSSLPPGSGEEGIQDALTYAASVTFLSTQRALQVGNNPLASSLKALQGYNNYNAETTSVTTYDELHIRFKRPMMAQVTRAARSRSACPW